MCHLNRISFTQKFVLECLSWVTADHHRAVSPVQTQLDRFRHININWIFWLRKIGMIVSCNNKPSKSTRLETNRRQKASVFCSQWYIFMGLCQTIDGASEARLNIVLSVCLSTYEMFLHLWKASLSKVIRLHSVGKC